MTCIFRRDRDHGRVGHHRRETVCQPCTHCLEASLGDEGLAFEESRSSRRRTCVYLYRIVGTMSSPNKPRYLVTVYAIVIHSLYQEYVRNNSYHWRSSSFGHDMNSSKNGISLHALRGSSLCFNFFSASSTSSPFPRRILSSSSSNSSRATSNFATHRPPS